LYWTTYCQSMLYYFASCFELSNTRLKKLQRLQQKVIIGRPWIQGAHLADVFSAFKIGPCCNLSSALRRAKVSLCLRIYGLQGILSAKDSHPILGTAKKTLLEWQCHENAAFQEAISLSIPPCQGITVPHARSRRRQRDENDAPVDLKAKRRNTNKFVAKLKESQKALNNKNALDYVTKKIRQTPLSVYTNCVLEGLVQLLETAHHKELSKVDRAYILRWFLGEEADWNFKLRINSVLRSKACCCGCTFVSNLAPFAAPTPSVCRRTMDTFFSDTPW